MCVCVYTKCKMFIFKILYSKFILSLKSFTKLDKFVLFFSYVYIQIPWLQIKKVYHDWLLYEQFIFAPYNVSAKKIF